MADGRVHCALCSQAEDKIDTEVFHDGSHLSVNGMHGDNILFWPDRDCPRIIYPHLD